MNAAVFAVVKSALLDALPYTDADRLVTIGEGEVEVAHEALLREWPRLGTWIEEHCTYTSLNFLLADGDSLYALRLPGTEGLFVRQLEAGEDLQGLSSYGTRTEGRNLTEAILFASERIDSASSWQELRPGTLAVADRDLRLEFHST